MADIKLGTNFASLTVLAKKGVRHATVVTIGCADGSFPVMLLTMGLLDGAAPLNIDPNPVYETSLQRVKDALGGDYRIAAISDAPGEMRMTQAAHPYWSSLRPSDDPYWDRVNKLSGETVPVPVMRLDDLIEDLKCPGPYLLHLDIQGSEVAALQGAAKVLEQTNVVIVEADIEDFRTIDAALNEAGFDLFDLTALSYARDQSLGWFYPVYINRKLNHLRERRWWDESANDAVIKIQEDRRRNVLAWYDTVLPQIKANRKPASG